MLGIVGVSTATGGIFGVGVMLAFAGVGYLMTILGHSVVTLIIAFSLRARFEASLSQGLALMNGDLTRVNDYPIAFILLLRKLAPPAGLEPATR